MKWQTLASVGFYQKNWMRRWRCLRIQGCFWCSLFFLDLSMFQFFLDLSKCSCPIFGTLKSWENKNPNVSWCCFCDSENQSFPGFVSRTWRFWSQSWFLTSQQIPFHRSAHKTAKYVTMIVFASSGQQKPTATKSRRISATVSEKEHRDENNKCLSCHHLETWAVF